LTGRISAHLLNAGRYSLTVVFGKDQRYELLRMDEVFSSKLRTLPPGRGVNMSVGPGVVRPLPLVRHSFKEECSLVKES